jgi:FliI/YscN family ATPase
MMLARLAPLPLSSRFCDGWVRVGRVTACGPGSLTVRMRGIAPGTVVEIGAGDETLCAEVCALCGWEATCIPLGALQQVTVGSRATSIRAVLGAYCGASMLGQCVDAWGRCAAPGECIIRAPSANPISLEERRPVHRVLATGIPAIDALCTLGIGQRVALFSGAGVGKSTLLRQIAERTKIDAHVVALIGERGREAAETVARLRESSVWPRTTVVCATAEASPRERFAAARTAIAQAEWLCERGDDVLLTMDSLTRVANAWRELALAAGEAPVHRGHPASMIGTLARMVERAGVRHRGSITGIFSVLVDGDDPFEPVTDAVRGLLDGHIVLSRRLADAGCFPPIDVLRSSSRIMSALASGEHLRDAALVRKAMATLERAEDLFAIGAYKPGGDPTLDAAVGMRERLDEFIFSAQACGDPILRLHELAAGLREHVSPVPAGGSGSS